MLRSWCDTICRGAPKPKSEVQRNEELPRGQLTSAQAGRSSLAVTFPTGPAPRRGAHRCSPSAAAPPGTAQRGAPHGRPNKPSRARSGGKRVGRSSTTRYRHLTGLGHPRSPPARTPGTRLKGSAAERRRSQLSDNPPPPPPPAVRPPAPLSPQPPAVPTAAAPAAPRPAPAGAASAGRPLPAPRPHRSAPAGTRRRGGIPQERGGTPRSGPRPPVPQLAEERFSRFP